MIGRNCITWHGVGRAHPNQPSRELIQIGLAQDDGTRSAQAEHHLGILGGGMAEGRAGSRHGPASQRDVILYRHRQAPKRIGNRVKAGQGRDRCRDHFSRRHIQENPRIMGGFQPTQRLGHYQLGRKARSIGDV